MAFLKQLVACLMMILLGGPPVLAQILAKSIPPPIGYTVANLPTSGIDGQMARVTDGDAAGSLIFWDASTSVWRCYSELFGEVNPTCPPYNVTAAAADNSAGLQKWLDRLVADETEPKKWGFLPAGQYTTTSPLDLIDDDPGQHYTIKGVIGGLSRIVCNYADADLADACLEVSTTSGTGNHLYIDNVGFRGGARVPDTLLYIKSMAQVRLNNVWISNYKTHGITYVSSFHGDLLNGLCIAADAATSGSGCIYLKNADSTNISGWNVEDQPSAGAAAFVLVGGFSAMRKIIVTNNNTKSHAGVLVKEVDKPPISGLTISNNSGNALQAGIVLSGNQNKEGVIITNNHLRYATGDTAASGDDCLNLHGLQGAVVANNHCNGFFRGIRSLNNDGSTFRSNVLRNIKDDCLWDWKNDANNLWTDTVVFGACGGTFLDVSTRTATGGGNVLEGTVLANAGALGMGDLFTTTSLAATDRLYLADKVQTVTCRNTRNGSSQTTADRPYYSKIMIDNDSTGGCDWTIAETDAYEGMLLEVTLKKSAGGAVNVIGAARTAIAVSATQLYRYTNSDWRKIN